jgi:Flp pilus assembly protein TadG
MMMGMGLRKLSARRPGQALVEFALVLVMLLLLMLGIVQFGRAWNLKQVLDDAAGVAARRAAVADPTVTLDTVRHVVMDRLRNSSFDTTNVTVNVFNFHAPRGTIVTVTVIYPYTLGWIRGLMGLTPQQANLQIAGQAKYFNE